MILGCSGLFGALNALNYEDVREVAFFLELESILSISGLFLEPF